MDVIKKLLKRITHSEFLAHTAPLFKDMNLLDLDGMNKYALGCYVYKNKDSLYNALLPVHRYGTRTRNLLRVPFHKTDIFTKSFLFQAPILWNNMTNNCPHILESHNLIAFKRQFKNFVLNN